MNRRFALISGGVVCTMTLWLGGCDENGFSTAGGKSSDARWEKVCAKPYFYNFLDARGQKGTVYCGEWKNECIGQDERPSDGCA